MAALYHKIESIVACLNHWQPHYVLGRVRRGNDVVKYLVHCFHRTPSCKPQIGIVVMEQISYSLATVCKQVEELHVRYARLYSVYCMQKLGCCCSELEEVRHDASTARIYKRHKHNVSVFIITHCHGDDQKSSATTCLRFRITCTLRSTPSSAFLTHQLFQ